MYEAEIGSHNLTFACAGPWNFFFHEGDELILRRFLGRNIKMMIPKFGIVSPSIKEVLMGDGVSRRVNALIEA